MLKDKHFERQTEKDDINADWKYGSFLILPPPSAPQENCKFKI
jgi:hypothetical protein